MKALDTIKFVSIILALCLVAPGFAKKPPPVPETNPYCCAPPYLYDIVKPNVLICLQMSKSMYRRASLAFNSGVYVDTLYYYGYFNPDSFYGPGAQGWIPGAAPLVSGNLLNWGTMSRLDVARKALFAGKGQPSASIVKNKLQGEGGPTTLANSGWPCGATVGGRTFTFSKPSLDSVSVQVTGLAQPIKFIVQVDYQSRPDSFNSYHRGIVHIFGDLNDDNKWDEDSPRMGLMFFSDNYQTKIMKEVIESEQSVSIEDFVNKINNNSPAGSYANPGEAIMEGLHYIHYDDPHFAGSYNPMAIGSKEDPYYTYTKPEPVPCRESFIIIIGDGEAHCDNPSIANCAAHTMPSGPFARNFWDYDADGNANDNVSAVDSLGAHNPADDYAYYGHITDLRSDIDGINKVTVYTLNAFGKNLSLYKDIAKWGGFRDQNGNNIPDLQSEWDKNADSVPDNYFYASNGYELRYAMAQIFMDLLTKVNSASGVSVVTTGMKGGGSTVQSQFYPKRNFPTGEIVDWIGNTHSLWLDPYGWIREDNVADYMLDLQNDYVIEMRWEPSVANVLMTRLKDNAGTGDPTQFDTVQTDVPIEDLKPVWNAGTWLWNAAAGDRTINAFIDSDKDGTVDAGEIVSFVSANAAQFRRYFDVPSTAAADTVIQYLRGTDFVNLRPRKADNKVWKLGDIISAGAVSVQPAIERYDFIYGDLSYVAYYDSCKNRRNVVYVGANDGMLHCFNAGKRVDIDAATTPFRLDPAGYDLGEELWAYIPFNVLPHLKWMQDSAYCHVYTVDLKPYATDAQIFDDDATHPGGWGTILICGMRLGGLEYKTAQDTFRSAYFAMDVTDPLAPVPMWEFTKPDLRLTVCYPTVIKVQNSWYLVFGSGPQTCSGECAAGAFANIYVLNLETGAVLKKWTLADDQSFVSDIFGVDWGMDYTVDRIYFGDCIHDLTKPGGWGGKIYRINTNDETNPNLWNLSFVFDMERPITAEGSIATDDYNHLWLYFGSGRFISEVDESDTTHQRFIGIREDTTRATTVAGLFNATDVLIDTSDVVHYPGGSTSSFDVLIDTVSTIGGWWRELNFPVGERNITTTLVFGGAVLFTTYIPQSDICSYGGEGHLHALYYRTGTAHINPVFLIAEDTLYNPTYVSVGQGMPSEPSLYVSGDQVKVFIQAAGGIVSPETGLPGMPRSGVILWKGR